VPDERNGAARRNIIVCTDVIDEQDYVPKTLREVGAGRIVGREVIRWLASLGSYGMGGPGFFGLRLAAVGDYSEEWLALRLWGADNWLLLDGQWVGAHPNQYHVQEPLISDFGGDESWDRVSEKVIGALIEDVKIERNCSLIVLVREAQTHRLEIPEDTSRLPLYGGTMQPHVWNPDEDQRDAWIVAQGELWV
jgi:hypothetical protein